MRRTFLALSTCTAVILSTGSSASAASHTPVPRASKELGAVRVTDSHGVPAPGAYVRADIALVGVPAPTGSENAVLTLSTSRTDANGMVRIPLSGTGQGTRTGSLNVELHAFLPATRASDAETGTLGLTLPATRGPSESLRLSLQEELPQLQIHLSKVLAVRYEHGCVARLTSAHRGSFAGAERPQLVRRPGCNPSGVTSHSLPQDGGSSTHTYPSDPCPATSGPQLTPPPGGVPHKYTTRVHDETLPVIDVSANAGDNEVVTVSSSTSTRLTYGVSLSGSAWKVGGTRTIANSSANISSLTANPGRYTTVRSYYRYADYRTYYCYGTRIDHYDDEISPASWSGSLYFGSNTTQALSAKSRYSSAASAGRAGFLETTGTNSTSNQRGRSWTFTMEGVVSLSAEMDYNRGTELVWHNTSPGRRYYYGTDERPFLATQTYVCDC